MAKRATVHILSREKSGHGKSLCGLLSSKCQDVNFVQIKFDQSGTIHKLQVLSCSNCKLLIQGSAWPRTKKPVPGLGPKSLKACHVKKPESA